MKLSLEIKKQIVRNAMDDTFRERLRAQAAECNAIALHAYSELYSADTLRKMAALPDEFFRQTSTVYIAAGGETKGFGLASSRKISAYDQEWHRPKWAPTDPQSIERVEAFVKQERLLDVDRKRFQQELEAFIAGFNTDKQLRDAWPEGEAFYASLLKEGPKNLPAVQASAINQLMTACKAGTGVEAPK